MTYETAFGVANYEYNRNTTVGIPVETHNLCVSTALTGRPVDPDNGD
ncbi:MAG: hypothetical protein LBD27_00990 [Tannerella sp.]|nr:hypothetical protein [Tannerella sp.]